MPTYRLKQINCKYCNEENWCSKNRRFINLPTKRDLLCGNCKYRGK